MYLKGRCSKCRTEDSFTKVNNHEIGQDSYLPGFYFYGGIRYYTFREVLVFFGVRKLANMGRCTNCVNYQVECPYCKNLLELYRNDNEHCTNCGKKFYLFK